MGEYKIKADQLRSAFFLFVINLIAFLGIEISTSIPSFKHSLIREFILLYFTGSNASLS